MCACALLYVLCKGKSCVFTLHDGSKGKTGKQTTSHPFFWCVEEKTERVDGLFKMSGCGTMIDLWLNIVKCRSITGFSFLLVEVNANLIDSDVTN